MCLNTGTFHFNIHSIQTKKRIAQHNHSYLIKLINFPRVFVNDNELENEKQSKWQKWGQMQLRITCQNWPNSEDQIVAFSLMPTFSTTNFTIKTVDSVKTRFFLFSENVDFETKTAPGSCVLAIAPTTTTKVHNTTEKPTIIHKSFNT